MHKGWDRRALQLAGAITDRPTQRHPTPAKTLLVAGTQQGMLAATEQGQQGYARDPQRTEAKVP